MIRLLIIALTCWLVTSTHPGADVVASFDDSNSGNLFSITENRYEISHNSEPNHFTDTNTWVNMNTSAHPSTSDEYAMTYDSESDRIILFGGTLIGALSNETWTYDFNTNTWINMKPMPPIPSTRSRHAMAYDSESDRVILFGGWVEVNYKQSNNNETWAYDFDTNIWTNMTPGQTTHPSARQTHAMAYDSHSDRVILFGGETGSGVILFGDTWAYDFNSNTWTNLSPIIRPTNRSVHAMAYDSESDCIMLFGGNDGHFMADTWAYNYVNNTWTRMLPATYPSHRTSAVMAYDSESDRTVLFGGRSVPNFENDTWAYDYNNNTWTNMTPRQSLKPSGRTKHVLAYDSESDHVILYGGFNPDPPWSLNDTWAYDWGSISAPVITYTNPRNGTTNISTDVDIVITFSEVMNKTATENAISSFPFIAGTFSWDIGMRSVTWAPIDNLTRKTKYTITINVLAKSQASVNMSLPYSFSFTTIPPPLDIYPPHIVGTNPKNKDTNVSIITKMEILWTESMNETSAQNAFSSIPLITCTWSWYGVNQTCIPDEPLQPTTRYVITISKEAKDLSGNKMMNEYIFAFMTYPPDSKPPYVMATIPVNGSIDIPITTQITIQWNEIMDNASAENAFTSSPTIDCVWIWNDNDQTCSSRSSLQYDTKYTITILTGSKDFSGNAMLTPYAFAFTTVPLPDTIPPTVMSTSPRDMARDVDTHSKITIMFSEQMDRNTTKSAISITRGSISKMEWDGSGRDITLIASLTEDTIYAVIISTKASDLAGNHMEKDYIFSFTTRGQTTDTSWVISSATIILITAVAILLIFVLWKRKRKGAMKELSK